MDGFEFAFSLFGLLLGLALAEALGGLARALKSRHQGWIGWPTALLGLFVACDVVTFWMYGWALHSRISVNWALLFGGFVVTGTYYVAASLIFPDDAGVSFDEHFERHHRMVIGGVVLCNAILVAYTFALVGFSGAGSLKTIVQTWSFFPVALTAALAKDRRIVLTCLIWLVLLYPLSVIWR